MTTATQIVAKKLEEIAQVADALDTTAEHLARAHRRQQRLIEELRRQQEQQQRRPE